MVRTLIVDDDEDMRFLIRATIEAANNGLRVMGEATNGEEALASYAINRPEVIVLDNRMPGMSGLEVAERILATHPEQSIILYSAYLDAETQASASKLGIKACLAKGDFQRLPTALWLHAPSA